MDNSILNNTENVDNFEQVMVSSSNVDEISNNKENEKILLLIWFCVSSARCLNLRLTQDQLTCLYRECLEIAKNCLDIAEESNEKRTEMKACSLLHEVYTALCQNDEAILYGNKVVDIAEALGDNISKMKAYWSLHLVYFSSDRYTDALSCVQNYHDVAKQSGIKFNEYVVYLTLGRTQSVLDEYDVAISNFKKSIDIAKHTGSKYCEMNAHLDLSITYRETQQYDEAIDHAKECIRIIQEISAKKATEYLEIATATGNKEAEMEAHGLLADTYNRSHQIDCGCKHATKGMAIAGELKNDTAMKKFRSLLSGFYAVVGMLEKASSFNPDMKAFFEVPKCLRQELEALVKAVKADDGNQQVMAYFRLYNYYKSMLQYERAVNCLKQLMVLQSNCSQAKLFYYAPIGELYIGMKKYKEGLQYCEGGLRELSGCKNKKIRFDFFFYISQLYAANNNLQLAEQYLNEAIQCFETFYGSLGSNDDFKMSAVDRYNGCFRFLSLVYVQTNRHQEALLVLDKCRARVLKDILVANYGMQENKKESDITFSDIETLVSSNQFAILYYSICGFGNALGFLLGYNCFEPSVLQVCFDEKKYHQVIDKMFDEIELLQEVNCEDRILDTDQDIKHQEQEEEEEDERGMYCFELRKRSFVVHKKTIWMYDNEKCRPATALELLYCLIIGEGQSLVKQSEIVFIPDGSLCKIPFAALQDPDTGKYLSETKRIRVAPSIATLKLLSENAGDYHSNEGALIIGDPRVGQVMLNGEVTEILQLKSADTEAKLVANSLDVKPLIGEEATKPAVLEKLQQGVSVVHIAAHGILSKATIVLAPSLEIRATKIPDEEDYMLTMAEVEQAQVRAQLVVLSCCHSGRGEIRAEGVVGMCRAFLASGARAVVASLWAIDDEATLEFMAIFYYNLKIGKSASTSLQETMNEMRNTCSKYKQPKYWAPFFLMGDDVTIKF